MESPNSKKQKHNEGQDMISKLPHFIIGRILSFLPTRDAVRTSVLSKSWISNWKFITELRIQDREPNISKRGRKNSFKNFVYMVLLRLNSSSIHSFSLDISENYEPLDQWISAVLSRRIKKLCVNSKDQCNLSTHSLLRYKSLEELVLNVRHCEMKAPTFALFSSLTVLNMSGIKFIGGPCNKSGKVHLDFPVLRTYKTENCTWSSSLKCVTLEAPLLEVVSINDFRSRSPSNDSYTAIKFCVSSLTEFTYNGYLFPDTIVFDLSAAHIASANIHIKKCIVGVESLQEMAALSSKLLKQFQNAKSLKFQRSKKILVDSYVENDLVLPLAKDSLADLPTFDKLSHMELGKVTGETLLALLLNTPNLKTLVILDLLKSEQEPLNYDRVPDCFLTTLQVVKFLSLDGSEHQLSFAKFVMENAVALKRMSFITGREFCRTKLEEVKEKLYSFKKCCSLILEFSDRSRY